jgi:hypothetical protein
MPVFLHVLRMCCDVLCLVQMLMASSSGGLVLSAPLTLALIRGRMGGAVVKRLHGPCTPNRPVFRPVSMKRHLSASSDKGKVADTSAPKGPQGTGECTRIEAMLGLPVGIRAHTHTHMIVEFESIRSDFTVLNDLRRHCWSVWEFSWGWWWSHYGSYAHM